MWKMTFREHVLQLGKAFKVQVVELAAMPMDQAISLTLHTVQQRQAFNLNGQIQVAPIHDEVTYAIALHEMGHVAGPGGNALHPNPSANLRIHQEQCAWDWAEHYAMEWTVTMASVRRTCLSTYFITASKVITQGFKKTESLDDFLARGARRKK